LDFGKNGHMLLNRVEKEILRERWRLVACSEAFVARQNHLGWLNKEVPDRMVSRL
jgi:hypothetical protein